MYTKNKKNPFWRHLGNMFPKMNEVIEYDEIETFIQNLSTNHPFINYKNVSKNIWNTFQYRQIRLVDTERWHSEFFGYLGSVFTDVLSQMNEENRDLEELYIFDIDETIDRDINLVSRQDVDDTLNEIINTETNRITDFTSNKQTDFNSDKHTVFTSERDTDFTSERDTDFTSEIDRNTGSGQTVTQNENMDQEVGTNNTTNSNNSTTNADSFFQNPQTGNAPTTNFETTRNVGSSSTTGQVEFNGTQETDRLTTLSRNTDFDENQNTDTIKNEQQTITSNEKQNFTSDNKEEFTSEQHEELITKETQNTTFDSNRDRQQDIATDFTSDEVKHQHTKREKGDIQNRVNTIIQAYSNRLSNEIFLYLKPLFLGISVDSGFGGLQ